MFYLIRYVLKKLIDGSIPLISNELQVLLPLDLTEIRKPEPKMRKLENDFYDEYIEIEEVANDPEDEDVEEQKGNMIIIRIFLTFCSSFLTGFYFHSLGNELSELVSSINLKFFNQISKKSIS
jgi:hypothetical protein